MKKLSIAGYFLLCTILLVYSYHQNQFRAVQKGWFNNFAPWSETFIVTRLSVSRRDGLFSHGGLSGFAHSKAAKASTMKKWPKGRRNVETQYEIYKDNLPIDRYVTYRSNILLQGVLFSILDANLSLTPTEKLDLFRLMVAMFSAIVLAFLVLWVFRVLGGVVSNVFLVLVLFSTWLTVAGGHLFWIFGAFYVPMVMLLFYLDKLESRKRPLWGLFFIAAAGFLVKCVFTGYEFVTSAVITALSPLVFYGIWKEWSYSQWLTRGLAAGVGIIVGILGSVFMLLVQYSGLSVQYKGVSYLVSRLLVRTFGITEVGGKEVAPDTVKSYSYDWWGVFSDYLGGVAFDLNALIGSATEHSLLKVSFGEYLALIAVLGVMLHLFGGRWGRPRVASATVLTTVISVTGPLSWYTLFNYHAYRHQHLDFLAWYLPFMVWSYVICGMLVATFAGFVRSSSRAPVRVSDEMVTGAVKKWQQL